MGYDVIVAPGADPTAFALAVDGATGPTLDAATGDLVLDTAAGEVRQHAPVVYQGAGSERRGVTGGYVIREDGTVGFVVGAYDSTLPLVIDPTLIYSIYLGGSGDDFAKGIAVDTSGNAYVTGYTISMNFPVTNGSILSGSSDAFVTKIAVPTIALSPATLPNGMLEASYNQTITASGCTAPYTFAVTSGALPPGLTLATNGTVSGTPTGAGSFTFSVTATDHGGTKGSRAYTLVVPPPNLLPAPRPGASPISGVPLPPPPRPGGSGGGMPNPVPLPRR